MALLEIILKITTYLTTDDVTQGYYLTVDYENFLAHYVTWGLVT